MHTRLAARTLRKVAQLASGEDGLHVRFAARLAVRAHLVVQRRVVAVSTWAREITMSIRVAPAGNRRANLSQLAV